MHHFRLKVAVLAAAFILLSISPAAAAPPEVTGVEFLTSARIIYHGVPAISGYDIYRSVLDAGGSGGAGGGGGCFLGSLQGTSADDADEPAPGMFFTYEVAAFDETGSGPLGFSSAGVEHIAALPCVPARRNFSMVVEQGPDGLEERAIEETQSEVGDGIEVVLHSGEVVVQATAGVGFFRNVSGLNTETEVEDYEEGGYRPPGSRRASMGNKQIINFRLYRDVFQSGDNDNWGFGEGAPAAGSKHNDRVQEPLVHTYRSKAAYSGAMGEGWDFSANSHLQPQGGDIVFHDGQARRYILRAGVPLRWTAPESLKAMLAQEASGAFALRFPDGSIRRYRPFDGSSTQGSLDADEDLAGNIIRYLYDHQGLLTTIVDQLGRSHTLDYDMNGRIARLTDFDGRETLFEYDASGGLVGVRSPIVISTPNGNDFPAGKTTRYTWSLGFADKRLNHNLLAITAPREEANGGGPFMQFTYGTTPSQFDYDRVVTQTIGTPGVVPTVGGTRTFDYQPLNTGFDPNDPMIPRRHTVIMDRNGNIREYLFNGSGRPLSTLMRTNRDLRQGEPDYLTSYTYDSQNRLLTATSPAGVHHTLVWSAAQDLFSSTNPVEVRISADALAAGGRGDGHGGEAPDIVWSFAWEPMGQQLLYVTDPQGRVSSDTYDYQEGDFAQNGVAAMAAFWGLNLSGVSSNLGDLDGDGRVDQARGMVKESRDPIVLLDTEVHQLAIEGGPDQESVTHLTHNDFGQLTRASDAEGNVHEFQYHPETDPDGDGTSTPPPADGRTLSTSGGGRLMAALVDTTPSIRRNNATNPPPVEARWDYEYDARGNLVRVVDPRGVATDRDYNALDQVVQLHHAVATGSTTGRGEMGLPPLGFLTRYAYDANDNLVRVENEDVGATRGAGQFIETTYAYDLLDNLVSIGREAGQGTLLVTSFERDANENLVLATSPAGVAHTFTWDERDLLLSETAGASGPRGGMPSTRIYAYDADGNPGLLTDGRGGLTDREYDGFNRLVKTVDSVGNTTEAFHDPSDNVLRILERGPVGGPTPPDRSGATNVDLADTRFLHDERDRLTDRLRMTFVPGPTVRPPMIVEGSLAPGDGAINTRYEYDKLSRHTFARSDTGATSRFDYDGASRMVRVTSPDGSTLDQAFDGDGNLIEQVELDLPSNTGPQPEQFFTTYFYDALGRRTEVVDNLGQTSRVGWNTLSDLGALTDARGPLGGLVVQRRSPAGAGLAIAINGHGNVKRHTYDPLGRPIRTELVLTATGLGDGTLSPSPASTTSNPDGLIRTDTAWDDDSLKASDIDDNGRVTGYTHDNIGHVTQVTADDGTMIHLDYDAEDNLTQKILADGSAILQTFDPAQRRIQVDINPQGQTERTTRQLFEYDGLSRVTMALDNNDPGVTGDNVTARFAFDSLGRQVEETLGLSDGMGPLVSDMAWLGEDLPTALTYPAGRRIEYTYDAAGRRVMARDPFSPQIEATWDYLGMERVHTRHYGNGVRSTVMDNAGQNDIGFDGARRAVLIRHLDPGGALLAGFEYRYDRTDSRASHRRLHQMDTSQNALGERYRYDSSDRLNFFQEQMLRADHLPAAAPIDSQTWDLDGAGNWMTFTRQGAVYLDSPNNNNEYDEMQSGGMRFDDGVPNDFGDPAATPAPDGLNMAHDKNGHLIFDGRHQLFYDAFGRLVRAVRTVDGVQVGSYTYDALGRPGMRTVIVYSGVSDSFRHAFWGRSELEQRDGGGALLAQTIHGMGGGGGGGIAQVTGSGDVTYLLEDGHGSTVAGVTAVVPQVLERVTYDAYGKPTFESPTGTPLMGTTGNPVPASPTGMRFLFAGMEYNPELSSRSSLGAAVDHGGTYMTAARTYDPDLGRFLTRDPAGVWFDAAAAGNGYAYAAGNPVTGTDPSGLASIAKLPIPIEKRDRIGAMYNPTELSVKKSVPWQKQAGGESAPDLEFSSAEGRSMSFELFFDSYEEKKSTRDYIFQNNLSNLEFAKSTPIRREYVVQYNESDWDFVRRLGPKVIVRGWDPKRKEEIIGSAPGLGLFNFSVRNIPLIGSISVGFTIVPPAAQLGSRNILIEYNGQQSNSFPFTKN